MSQLSIEARPHKWSEVAGQSIPKTILKKIAENPEASPKVIQLYGGFGVGKTSLLRVFAAEVNKIPYDQLKTSPFLQELDSSQLNKDTIDRLIESWYASPAIGWRVICIDENHLLSKQTQSALLKVLEELPPHTFIMFATTDYEKVLDTIKSRSLDIKLEVVPHDEVIKNIFAVSSKFNVQMDDEVAERICQVSKGHMRTVHQNISKYELLGRDEFLSLFKSSYNALDHYFQSIPVKSKDKCFQAIDEILQYPLVTIRDDFESYILALTKSLVNQPNELVQSLGANTLKLIKYTMSDWFKSCFDSDVELQTGLLCLYQLMTDVPTTSATVRVNPNARR